MKKLLALILSSLILCSFGSCASDNTANTDNTENTTTSVTTEAETENETIAPAAITGATPEAKEAMESLERQGFQGVAYIMKDGETLATYAKGMIKNDKSDAPITIDTPMPIGSVSKQFCSASIFLLQEQGKLSIEDTLDKYYPDYKHGKIMKIKNLMAMRSGIPEYTENVNPEDVEALLNEEKTPEEVVDFLKDWILNQELDFQPDDEYYYSNSNYHLLADIVEQVSGLKYDEFLRKNIFEPLGMTHTGTIDELSSSPEWAQGNTYKDMDNLLAYSTKGDGNIISNCADMMIWMDSLPNGKVVSPESYKAMSTNYSDSDNYGYGLETIIVYDGSIGHTGYIPPYNSVEYINDNDGMMIFMSSNTNDIKSMFERLVLNLQE